jgi:hypothetical protein
MKNSIEKYIVMLLGGLLTYGVSGCKDDIDPLITELETERPFAPVGLEARVRNQTDLELSWNANGAIDEYIIEIFQDSLLFAGDPVATDIIDDIPSSGRISFTQSLAGDTRYSARLKAVVAGKPESTWATITERTNPEQIFLLGSEIAEDTYATVFWIAGSQVTNFLIVPGNIVRPISSSEKAAGEAIIEGLSGATDYTVTIYNGTARRGTTSFSTIKQADLTPLDDLAAAIDAAAEGETLVLAAGTYHLGAYSLTSSVALEGQKPIDMPVVIGNFQCDVAVASFSVTNIRFQGDNGAYSQFFNAAAATCNIGAIQIEGCEISGYSNNIIYSNSGGTYGDISITNSYIHDIEGGGGDGFDFRGGIVGSLAVTNTTIAHGVRTLLRMQVPADVVFRNCTFYRVCIVASGNNRGFFRMSGGGDALEVSSCLFVETGIDDNGTLRGNWSRDGDISPEVVTDYDNNFYFNVIGLFEGQYTDPAQVDATEEDPGFKDPENGDFGITSQNLIDNQVGDPRWWF